MFKVFQHWCSLINPYNSFEVSLAHGTMGDGIWGAVMITREVSDDVDTVCVFLNSNVFFSVLSLHVHNSLTSICWH